MCPRNDSPLLIKGITSFGKNISLAEVRNIVDPTIPGTSLELLKRHFEILQSRLFVLVPLPGADGLVHCLVPHHILKNMKKEVGPILTGAHVLGERAAQGAANTELLRRDKGLQHHLYAGVHVVVTDVFANVHLGVGLGHAHHRFDVTDGNGDSARGGGFASQSDVKGSDLLLIECVAAKDGPNVRLCILDVLAKELLGDDFGTVRVLRVLFFFRLLSR